MTQDYSSHVGKLVYVPGDGVPWRVVAHLGPNDHGTEMYEVQQNHPGGASRRYAAHNLFLPTAEGFVRLSSPDEDQEQLLAQLGYGVAGEPDPALTNQTHSADGTTVTGPHVTSDNLNLLIANAVKEALRAEREADPKSPDGPGKESAPPSGHKAGESSSPNSPDSAPKRGK